VFNKDQRLLAIVAGLLLLAGFANPSHAQLTRTPLVAVLDFPAPQSPIGSILARQATDAMVLEMQRTSSFEVLPRGQVRETLRELDITAPQGRSDFQRLGRALGVEYIAVGNLNELVIRDNPRRYQATLSVLLFDVSTGEYSNGAIATGIGRFSQLQTPVENNLFLEEQTQWGNAISDAAFDIVATMSSFQLPQATVLHTIATEVLLNGGVRNGIRPGQELIVMRQGRRVGRVRVTTSSSQDAWATILDAGIGIQPQDRARAVVDPGNLPQRIR
jgi:TolB-like protein